MTPRWRTGAEGRWIAFLARDQRRNVAQCQPQPPSPRSARHGVTEDLGQVDIDDLLPGIDQVTLTVVLGPVMPALATRMSGGRLVPRSAARRLGDRLLCRVSTSTAWRRQGGRQIAMARSMSPIHSARPATSDLGLAAPGRSQSRCARQSRCWPCDRREQQPAYLSQILGVSRDSYTTIGGHPSLPPAQSVPGVHYTATPPMISASGLLKSTATTSPTAALCSYIWLGNSATVSLRGEAGSAGPRSPEC